MANSKVRDLTVVSCTGGLADCGVGELIKAGVVKRLVASYIGENNHIFDNFLTGKLEVELVPQVQTEKCFSFDSAVSFVTFVAIVLEPFTISRELWQSVSGPPEQESPPSTPPRDTKQWYMRAAYQ